MRSDELFDAVMKRFGAKGAAPPEKPFDPLLEQFPFFQAYTQYIQARVSHRCPLPLTALSSRLPRDSFARNLRSCDRMPCVEAA